MRILFIGDIVGKPGRKAVKELLPQALEKTQPDIVIGNSENLVHGRGVSSETLTSMMEAGIDCFTGGDHSFWHGNYESISVNFPIIRPANYPFGVPGEGFRLVKTKKNDTLLLINVMGRTFLNERLDDPFTKVDEILNKVSSSEYDATLVDFHAEATSEKHALAFYLDGRVNAIVGTHTHVPTCDNRVLPKRTLYVSDVGMAGNLDSVLGVDENVIIAQYLTAQNQRFEWKEQGRIALRSVIIDTKNGTIDRMDMNI